VHGESRIPLFINFRNNLQQLVIENARSVSSKRNVSTTKGLKNEGKTIHLSKALHK
jgi:hypothetical protein